MMKKMNLRMGGMVRGACAVFEMTVWTAYKIEFAHVWYGAW